MCLGELLCLADDVSGVRSRAITGGRELLSEALSQMESLAVVTGDQLKQSQAADDAYWRARRTLESEWLEAESAVADLMSQAVRSINLFVANAEFNIDKFETNLQEMIARERACAPPNGVSTWISAPCAIRVLA